MPLVLTITLLEITNYYIISDTLDSDTEQVIS